MTYSGLSRGTERLVFEGRLPESEWGRMRAPHQSGDFPFPVKYGYSAVGLVEAGPAALIGRRVFALYPHQTHFALPESWVIPLPDAVPSRRAILSANMETALNALWDSGAAAGQRIAVIGAGLVGCLIASLAARLPGAQVTLIDILPERAQIAAALGARFSTPAEAEPGAEIVFHTSASEAGLRLALDIAAFEGRIVEVSWFGDKQISLPLGGAFHSQRLQIICSQVGHVATPMRASKTHRERLETAIGLLDDARLDALITGEVAFDDLPAALPRLLAADASGIATAIRY
ncbi:MULTISPECIES: zinc-binding alcohol dehydrogenase [Rhodomicrobium]|uniref:zinc-dependent alcohol dehydrogenase n=1 Tax=Rhodomicrobium TaxID=1068 RepID=UPI001FD94199|nr:MULTISPECIES: zinc-binding alcohol dehydrogenase [Rhodomicrobium]